MNFENMNGRRLALARRLTNKEWSAGALGKLTSVFCLLASYSPLHRPCTSTHVNRIPLLVVHPDQNATLEMQLAAGDENAAGVITLLDFRNDGEGV